MRKLIFTSFVLAALLCGCAGMSKAEREFTTQLSLQYAATKYARTVADPVSVAANVGELLLALGVLKDPSAVLPLVANYLGGTNLLPEDRMLIMSLAEIGLRNVDIDFTVDERIQLVIDGLWYFKVGLEVA